MRPFEIRAVNESDHESVARLLQEHWGSTRIVTRGRTHDADRLPGFVAVQDREVLGLLTYQLEAGECEIVTLDSTVDGIGIGSALLGAVKDVAASANCKRLWAITTNDNTPALRFYQKRGFSLVAVHCNAIEESRRLKPEIPLVGLDGIPIRDEVELELLLPGSKVPASRGARFPKAKKRIAESQE
jgi:GNAT superfamily N-acetyltransferase